MLVALCCISVVTCLCVSIFTALHLSQLFSMSCHTLHTAVRHPPRDQVASITGSQQYGLSSPVPRSVSHLAGIEDDEDEMAGSGDGADDEVDVTLEFETVTLGKVSVGLDHEIVVNVTSCECEKKGATWVRTRTYHNLSCPSVKNVLPVLFVASCVVTAVGAVLSALILYLLWSFKNSFYAPAKPHETRPFIFTSNFNKSKTKTSNGSGSRVSNGDSQFR